MSPLRAKTDVELAWEIVGEGPALIAAIHPLAMDRRFWQWLQTDLGAPMRWLLCDLPGHGDSPLPTREYGIEDVAGSLGSILQERLGPAHLIGASFGGMVGVALAARHPPLVRSVVVADSTARYADGFGWNERAAVARTQGMAPLVEGTMSRWFSKSMLESGGPEINYVRGRLREVDPEGYALACLALERADLRGGLGQIEAPVLVIAGDDDPLAEDGQLLAGSIPNASLTWLQGAKHGAPLERRHQFASAVARFLKSAGATDR